MTSIELALPPPANTRQPALMSVSEAARLIESGRVCWLAGDAGLLARLPRGHWLGGTIHYFMTGSGTAEERELLHVTALPEGIATRAELRWYDVTTISGIATDAPDHGYTLVVMPARSPVHLRYAEEAPEFPDMFMKPIAGWVTGVHLADATAGPALVVNGATGETAGDRALALHVTLRPEHYANVAIFNAYRQGHGPEIEFPVTGFVANECRIDGAPARLADYLRSIHHDQRLPLVANYSGAMINVAVQELAADSVSFYAPVFAGVRYRIAEAPAPQPTALLAAAAPQSIFACNCVLNYLYADPELVTGGGLSGPMSFGEIAYQLLNQTLVYLTIEHV